MSEPVKLRDMRALAAYRDQLRLSPRLTYLFLELTDCCNLACEHCGSGCSGTGRTYLDADAACRLLDQLADHLQTQTVMICLTGGEPLLHPRLTEIIAHAHDLGFPTGMTTNGTLIDQAAAEMLLSAGLDTVTVSLDGIEATNDRFRNKPGAFRAATDGIRWLLQRSGDFPVQVTTVVHKRNFSELPLMQALLSDMRICSWRLINVEPIGRALTHPEDMLDEEELRALFAFIRDRRYSPQVGMEVTYGCSHYLTPAWERTVRDFYFQCGAGILAASILCNGDIFGCLDIERRPELIQGNIAHDDFWTVWQTGFQAYRADRTADCDLCLHCEDRIYCGGDSLHTWDFDLNRPRLCLKQTLSPACGARKDVKS